MKIWLGILVFFLFGVVVQGQIRSRQAVDSITLKDLKLLPSVTLDGEKLPHQTIGEVYVLPEKKFRTRRQFRQYTRLMYNVRKVYPYAQLASARMEEMEAELSLLKTEKEKKEYIDQVEKELFSEFEDDLRNMTITQGRILIKLVDRETGDTSYELIHQLKGSFPAFFWQSIARIFGSNLKSEYDPSGEDAQIEEIVRMIEMGYI